MTRRTWRCYAPGYRIRGYVASYGGGHMSQGKAVWELFCRYRESYPELGVWLEFGSMLSIEDRDGSSSGDVVWVEPAHCTGLIA